MTKRRVAEPTAEYMGRRKPTNLSLHAEAISRGEAYAAEHQLSLSELVNRLLRGLPDPREGSGPNPDWGDAVTRLYELGRRADPAIVRFDVDATADVAPSDDDVADYHEYLARKYEVP